MKNIAFFLLVVLCFSTSRSYGQSADGITYQAVALDYSGKINGSPISNKQISVRFSILKDTQEGELVYGEVHSASTDQYGLFTLVIGHGDVSPEGMYQKLIDINWGSGKLFLKVEIDIRNAGDFKLMGIQQMMAVPFAFHSLTASLAEIHYSDILDKPLFSVVASSGSFNDLKDKPLLFSGSYNDLKDKPLLFSGSYNDLRDRPIVFSGSYNDLRDRPQLFSGSYNDLRNKPDLFDGNYNSLINRPSIPREASDEFSAGASQTVFNLANVPLGNTSIRMYINGVRISNSAYRSSGATITYQPGNNGSYVLVSGDRIQFDYSY